ncbi:MAG: UDP-3-O-(3-hydroxymyristoyl)glucosamine N-acyltransferase [Gemmataceae bacterium]
MSVTLQQLAELVNGQLHGAADLVIQAARPLHSAQPGDITFIENVKHAANLEQSQASAVLVPLTWTGNGRPMIRVADPLMAFVSVVRHLRGWQETRAPGIDPRAAVHPDARLGPDAYVGPFASIGAGSILGARCQVHDGAVVGRHCRIGDDVVLHPHVVLYDGTVLGNRIIIHANAVIGADGYGYRFKDGRHVKVPQLGHVEIEDDVEIGACACIDRATFEVTRIGQGTKIDNLVQIAHNCQIGRHNLFASQVGIAGSCQTGQYVVLAGQVGVADHLRIGDGVQVGAQAGLAHHVPPGKKLMGTPAIDAQLQARVMVTLEKLPVIRRDVHRIKKRLGISDDQ